MRIDILFGFDDSLDFFNFFELSLLVFEDRMLYKKDIFM